MTKTLELTALHKMVLRYIRPNPDTTVYRLESVIDAMGCTRKWVEDTVDELVLHRLVNRRRYWHGLWGWQYILELTEKGRAALSGKGDEA